MIHGKLIKKSSNGNGCELVFLVDGKELKIKSNAGIEFFKLNSLYDFEHFFGTLGFYCKG